jgi:hypothetical protein
MSIRFGLKPGVIEEPIHNVLPDVLLQYRNKGFCLFDNRALTSMPDHSSNG